MRAVPGGAERGFDRWLPVLACSGVLTGSGVALLVTFVVPDDGAPGRVAVVGGLFAAARALAFGLFFMGGVLRLCRWRIFGETRSALLGVALVVLALISVLGTGPGRAADGVLLDPAGPLVRSLGSLVCMVLVLCVLGRADLADRAPWSLLAAAAALLALPPAGALVAPGLVSTDGLGPGWVALGLLAGLGARGRPWSLRISPLLAGLGAAELMRALGGGRDAGWLLGAQLLTVSVAALVAYCALVDLDNAVRQDEGHLSDVSSALGRAREAVQRDQAVREEMTHDVRNATAGLRAALLTLETYGGRLDESQSLLLRRAALAEIGHLEHLVLRPPHEEARGFDVAAVVGSVVEVRRTLGAEISVLGGDADLVAHGRPGDLATALRNLLVNAEVHAPASPVLVNLVDDGDRVLVVVADQGPGLGDGEVAHVFERGGRGPTSPGSGLGLHVARSLMRDQGGDLELSAWRGGATFVLSVPARPAPARPAALRPVEVAR